MKKKPMFEYLCERGNTWLVSPESDMHAAWFDLPDGNVMGVFITPENYPGFEIITLTEKDKRGLAKHIKKLVKEGWYPRKANHAPGVGEN